MMRRGRETLKFPHLRPLSGMGQQDGTTRAGGADMDNQLISGHYAVPRAHPFTDVPGPFGCAEEGLLADASRGAAGEPAQNPFSRTPDKPDPSPASAERSARPRSRVLAIGLVVGAVASVGALLAWRYSPDAHHATPAPVATLPAQPVAPHSAVAVVPWSSDGPASSVSHRPFDKATAGVHDEISSRHARSLPGHTPALLERSVPHRTLPASRTQRMRLAKRYPRHAHPFAWATSVENASSRFPEGQPAPASVPRVPLSTSTQAPQWDPRAQGPLLAY
jgi:hypothetical protein